MERNKKNKAWTMAIAIAGMVMTACSLDAIEPEKPFTTCPPTPTKLVAFGFAPTDPQEITIDMGTFFTEDDIEWFNVNTRELRFKKSGKLFCEKLPMYDRVKFYLGGQKLFTGGATRISIACSQVFDDLVLCQGKIDGDDVDYDHYYLLDCYPPQFINDEKVQAHIASRAMEWDTFIHYLDRIGKLKK